MTLSKLDYFPKASPPDITTWGTRALRYGFGGHVSVPTGVCILVQRANCGSQ